MKISQVNTDQKLYKALQEFVSRHGLVFSSSAWLKNYSGGDVRLCAIQNNNDEIIGCFCYYVFKKGFFELVITPPYAPDIGLYYINPAESIVGKNSFTKDLVSNLADYFAALNADLYDLSLPSDLTDSQPFTWKGFLSKRRYSYLLDLRQSEEDLWNNLATEKRKSLNRAGKDEVIASGSEDWNTVHDLVCQSLKRNKVYKNPEIIKNIICNFSSSGKSYAFISKKGPEVLGASFCVTEGDTAFYLFGGFDDQNKHHGAGVACMWQSILKAKKLGLNYFDFEGSMNPRIEKYFREFGGMLTPHIAIEKIKPLLKLLMYFRK